MYVSQGNQAVNLKQVFVFWKDEAKDNPSMKYNITFQAGGGNFVIFRYAKKDKRDKTYQQIVNKVEEIRG